MSDIFTVKIYNKDDQEIIMDAASFEVAKENLTSNAQLWQIQYLKNDKIHKDDGPAEVWFDYEGHVSSEAWYVDGKRSRTKGPAVIGYEDGVISDEDWYLEDKRHRIGGPAIVKYDTNSNKIWEEWYFNGQLHNPHGAAKINYGANGGYYWEEYFLCGKKVNKEKIKKNDN